MNKKHEELFDEIYDKTISGDLKWGTWEDNGFFVDLPPHYMAIMYNDQELCICTDMGEVIEKIDNHVKISDLFSVVRNSVLKIDDMLDEIIEALV